MEEVIFRDPWELSSLIMLTLADIVLTACLFFVLLNPRICYDCAGLKLCLLVLLSLFWKWTLLICASIYDYLSVLVLDLSTTKWSSLFLIFILEIKSILLKMTLLETKMKAESIIHLIT